MKRVLLGTSALCVLSLGAASAFAEEGIHVTVGGHFKEAYMVVFDDDEEGDGGFPGDLGNEHNTDGFFNDAEIDFNGTTILDNGLEVGAHVELEGETDGDQIDEAYIWFAGGFGEIRIGSDDEALHKACVAPPGGSSNFSAFSPNQWGAEGFLGGFAPMSDNSICRGVDDLHDAQKIIYTSPVFGGFQLTASYTPSGGSENHTNGGGPQTSPHTGMPEHFFGQSRHNTSVAINYGYDGGGWGLQASLGGSWEGHVEEGSEGGGEIELDEQDFYQAGINLFLGNFAFGIGGEYYNDAIGQHQGDDASITNDIWVAGAGASYTRDAWIFGVQYSHREDDLDFNIGPDLNFDFTQDRIVGTTTYLLGPGVNLDAEIGYTWLDSDPELDIFGNGDDIDDYQAFEIGLGATVIF